MSKHSHTSPRRSAILGLAVLSLLVATGCGDAAGPGETNLSASRTIDADMMPPHEATSGLSLSFFSFAMPAESEMTAGVDGKSTVTVKVVSGNGRIIGTATRPNESGMAVFDDLVFEGSGTVTVQAFHVGSGRASATYEVQLDDVSWPTNSLPEGASERDVVTESMDLRHVLVAQSDRDGKVHLYLHDRKDDTTAMVSLGRDGTPAGVDFGSAQMSEDGRYIAYMSRGETLSVRDGNGMCDVFVYDSETGTNHLVSRTPDGMGANGESRLLSISANGRYVVFTSTATNLVDPSKLATTREMGPRTYRMDLATKVVEIFDGPTR